MKCALVMITIITDRYWLPQLCEMNTWIPPRSPGDLIQESLWPDEWKILVACMLLNQTTRKQLDKVVGPFFERWPTPHALLASSPEEIGSMLKPLGFWRRRPLTLLKFSRQYIDKQWKEPKELHGVGKYASDAWHIFIKGDWKAVEPNDHALNFYHNFLKERDGDASENKSCSL